MRRFLRNLGRLAAAAFSLLPIGCSVSTAPGTILGPHVDTATDPATTAEAKAAGVSRASRRAHAYGGWTPTYYHGRLMYHDDMGQPFFYSGETRVFVSTSSPQYGVARDHWRRNQYAYDRWHAVYHKPRYRRSRR